MKIPRRRWLTAAGVLAFSAPLGAWLLRRDPDPRPGPRGALRPDPDGVFDLHEGFSYRVVDRAGARTSEGLRTLPRPDGMACFAGEQGGLLLVRNHELPVGALERPWRGESYDPHGGGAAVNRPTGSRVSNITARRSSARRAATGVIRLRRPLRQRWPSRCDRPAPRAGY